MPLEVKQGRKVGIFLKDNIPTDKNSFVEREVYVTLQGSRTGKETKVKLKINAGRRHPAIQSNTGAVTLSQSGQIVETFNPSQIKDEIEEVEKVEEIIEKMEELEKEKIIDPSPEVEEEIEKQLQKLEEVASGEDLSATTAQKKAAKATQTAVQKSQAKAAALSEKLASKGITKKSASKTTQRKDPRRKKKGGLTLMG
jgi:Fe2+ transport system protein B